MASKLLTPLLSMVVVITLCSVFVHANGEKLLADKTLQDWL